MSRPIRRTLAGWLALCWLLVGTQPGQAQTLPAYDTVYRPPEADYQVLESPHFEVIFEAGYEAAARETAAILEADLDAARSFVGMRRTLRMPVVLNGFNDVANGYVTAFPFKQEIEIAALKGNRLSPLFPSWLWAVTPHELLHAVHAEGGEGFGVGMMLRPFAPDLARAMTLWMPRGLVEGAAVYHESLLQPRTGRLHLAPFQMQFRAAMASDDPWSLAQMLEQPVYDTPADRMYIGGSNFFAHVAQTQGLRFFRRMVDASYRYPFIGSGLPMWRATGETPRQLWISLRDSVQAAEAAWWQAKEHGVPPEKVVATKVVGARGNTYRRPRWLNDSTLVVYASGYAKRAGFYRVDAASGAEARLSTQRITEDFSYSLNADSTALLFSRYIRDPFSSLQATSEAFRLDLETGKATQLTSGGRVFAPVAYQQDVWAVRNEGAFSQWVKLRAEDAIEALTETERVLYLSLHPSPDAQTVAVLRNDAGKQGLYRATFDGAGTPTLEPWLVFEHAAVYDAAWSPDSRYLLFTADFDARLNIYAFDTETATMRQLTDVRFGAQEPSVSPDGRWLAFVNYEHEAYTIARLPFAPETAPLIQPAFAHPTEPPPGRLPTLAYEGGAVEPYRALSYLKPRMLYPLVGVDLDDGALEGLGVQVGAAVEGVDPLQRWAYGAYGFYQDGRLWGNVAAQSGRYLLRPYAVAYDLPTAALVRVVNERTGMTEVVSARREERGIGVGVRLPVVLRANVYSTSLLFSLQGAWEQEQLTDRAGNVLLPFRHRLTLSPTAQWAYRLQANPRDLIPNTGLVVRTTASVDVFHEARDPRQAMQGGLTGYVPLQLRTHTGVQLQAEVLTQNQGSIFNTDTFLPRGYEDAFLGSGTFAKAGATVVQPLRFLEDGGVLVPVYFHVLYAYGFGETVRRLEGQSGPPHISSVGGGLGLQLRLLYTLSFDLRVGAAYQIEEREWAVTFR